MLCSKILLCVMSTVELPILTLPSPKCDWLMFVDCRVFTSAEASKSDSEIMCDCSSRFYDA